LVVDEAVHQPQPWQLAWLYLIPFLLAYLLYLPTVGAAVRWGTEVRAAMDLNRLRLYQRLAVRAPTSFSDEREVAKRVNQLLLYGVSPPDSFWAADARHRCCARGGDEAGGSGGHGNQ
jgi:hypothetical protein